MLALIIVVGLLGLWVPVTTAALREDAWTFTFTQDGTKTGGLQLAGSGVTPEIRVSPDDFPGVIRAANDLAGDFGKVLGTNATVVSADWRTTTSSSSSSSRPLIIVGTVGRSSLINGLSSANKIDVTQVAGKWEVFSHQVVSAPWEGRGAPVFVIAGSDLRGTSFGVYDVSEQIGVSPWWYWADAAPTKRQYIWAHNPPYVSREPTIQYRGLFLNDEAPALTGWGGQNFRASQYGSPFVSGFYQRIFDLVVRNKCNYVWPAMWSSMFYLDDAKNGPMADEYGVFMGTSHHEPMARADKEQGRFLRGSWDWRSNKNGVQTFMQEGAERSKVWNHTVYTVGMRGSGDAASATLNSAQLEEIIAWQTSTLTRVLGKDASKIPACWMMYKEVPGYWANGMKISEHVTLVWSDDNRGNIRRIPITSEMSRPGGSGMYYHFDYVGSPRNYKWINTIQLQKTWEQMKLAHDRGVRKLWIANVGDLKALELPTAHFLSMAYDMTAFEAPDSTTQWLRRWSRQQYGGDDALTDEAAAVMTTYGKLTARRKYEDLSNSPFAFDVTNYDEAELNLREWEGLVDRAQAVHDKLPQANQAAFFTTVLHPVLAGKQVFEIYTKVALGNKYANQHRVSASQLANDANAAYAADQALQRRWNAYLGGKWNGFMAQTHIGYDNWQEPSSNRMPRVTYVNGAANPRGSIMGVAVQGSASFFPTATTLTLEAANPYLPTPRWVEVFARENGTFAYTITSNASFVTVDAAAASGTINAPGAKSDIRAPIAIDWSKAPAGRSAVSLTITNTASAGGRALVTLPLDNPTSPPPSSFRGHVEASGVVSMEAGHHDASSAGAASYVTLPNYGRTHSGAKLINTTPSQSAPGGPALSFPFYSFSSASNAGLTIYLASSLNANPDSPSRFAYSLDGAAPQTVQPVPNHNAGTEPSGWSQAVIDNAWVRTARLGSVSPGKHELRVWLLEPTMVLTKVVVDLGGLKSSTMGPPESVMVGG